MRRKSSLYIKDIIDAITKIEEFTKGITYEEIINDDKTSSAVIRKIEIIGEAVKQLPEDIRNRFSEIPWSPIAKMRDKVIHFYHGVDHEVIWKVVKDDLPSLKQKLQGIYAILKKEEER